jgi:predicted transcriptional regulator
MFATIHPPSESDGMISLLFAEEEVAEIVAAISKAACECRPTFCPCETQVVRSKQSDGRARREIAASACLLAKTSTGFAGRQSVAGKLIGRPVQPESRRRRIRVSDQQGFVMNDTIILSKSLARRLRRVSAKVRQKPETIAREAIAESLDYLEWKEKALARGEADLKADRVLTTEEVFAAIERQRARRARKSGQAA